MLDLAKWDGDVDAFIKTIMVSHDVAALDELANQASTTGAIRTALAYLAAYRIYEIYLWVDAASDNELHLTLEKRDLLSGAPKGSTGLRRYFNESMNGWPTFNAWLEDWTSGAPGISRSSGWTKMWDILGWRNLGVSWETILKLLANTPMAGRDFLEKPVQPEALPSGGKPQYLEELAELPPGQARKKVSEDSGEIQIWTADAQWHQGGLLLKIILETSEGTETYDLIVRQVSGHESWMAVAYWLTKKLGRPLLIGG